MTYSSPDVARVIKQIEITTRRLLSGSQIGDSRSALKGSGLEFDQIREYQQGDDVRFVDWRATARAGKLLVKQYIEERNRTVVVAVDCSASLSFASGEMSKQDLMAKVASVLALTADYGKDQVGLLLFTDEVECFIPPARGRHHVRAVMEALFSHKPQSKKTRLAAAVEKISQLKRSDVIVFLLSDFIDDRCDKELAILAHRFDVVAVRCRDARESVVPVCGLLLLCDSETGEESLVDTRNARLNRLLVERDEAVKRLLRKLRIDSLELTPHEDFWRELIAFFRRRMRY
jgi:uncharacterized protein (DUF58 family)